MNWTTEMRYLPYHKWSAKQLLDLQFQAANSKYQLQYHIRPTSGLLNDPNGFSFFNDKWHVFYQAYPFGPVHGVKSWVHLQSDDLVHWQNLGVAIEPDTPFDSHGAYSGSARQVGDKLFLMYTGNVRDQDWVRHPYQLGAWMDQNNHVTKLPQPLFGQSSHTTDHFRDPQLLKQDDTYYALLGAQDKDSLRGKVAVYASKDLQDWQDLGYLDFTDQDLGFMVECPSLVYVDNQPILIFCPQGVDQKVLNCQNIYPNAYVIGDNCDLAKPALQLSHQTIHNLDDGFDVYASQAFNAPYGQAYLISWVGLPEISYPSDVENWAHCLSVVKQLSLKDGQLYQQPVAAMQNLRQNPQELTPTSPQAGRQDLLKAWQNQYELQLELPVDAKGTLHLAGSEDLSTSLQLHFDTQNGQLIFDRGQCDEVFATEWGTTRQLNLPAHQALKLQIFVDHSLCEIFVNDGQHVMTGRFFNFAPHTQISLISEQKLGYTGKYWELCKM